MFGYRSCFLISEIVFFFLILILKHEEILIVELFHNTKKYPEYFIVISQFAHAEQQNV